MIMGGESETDTTTGNGEKPEPPIEVTTVTQQQIAEQAEQTEQADQTGQTDQANPVNQPDQTNEVDQTSQNEKTDENENSDQKEKEEKKLKREGTKREDYGESSSRSEPHPVPDALSSQRVYKKSSPNSKLTLYLSSRDLVVTEESIDRLQGVLLVDPEFVENKKVYGQVTLTFRYGREDEEVMGLKFCNEAVMCLAQLYPPPQMTDAQGEPSPYAPPAVTPLQEALVKRLGPNAYPFTMEITPLAPPSVQLVPAKEYSGAPIGTSYDVRAYVADRPDEKFQKKNAVRMGIRVVQRAMAPPSPLQYVPGQVGGGSSTSLASKRSQQSAGRYSGKISLLGRQASEAYQPSPEKSSAINGSLGGSAHSTPSKQPQSASHGGEQGASDNESSQMENIRTEGDTRKPHQIPDVPAPRAMVDKPFLLSDGRVSLEASLDKAIYSHGEQVKVRVCVHNSSSKTVRRMKVFVVQFVDVCMFSNGKFKNVVAMLNPKDDCPVLPGHNLDKTYGLQPSKGATKNWIALEDSYSKSGTSLASTVTCHTNNPEDRNVFAIYVSYYVKVKLVVSVMGGELSLKLPFTLMHTCPEYEQLGSNPARILRHQRSLPATGSEVRPDKDGTT